MFQSIKDKTKQICVIGMGYVGLPIALEFAKHYKVIGFDINSKRVDMLKNHEDPSKEIESDEFKNKDIVFTDQLEDLEAASFYIVAVPTPIDDGKNPDLKPLQSASKAVGKVISKGDYVVYESTVYPGCTEEDCIPVIEKYSKLSFPEDFKVGYSPERINPGDKVNTITKITKIVSGCDKESLRNISDLYGSIIEAGIHEAPTIKVAEAAKIVENTQRDLNISLMNELSLIFDKMNINTYDVIEAAGTKWNFLKFYPGLVGGHCIGVDPYYLTYRATELGIHPRVIAAGRFTNDMMGAHIAKVSIKKLIGNDKQIRQSKILIMGATFKENVSDIRNSKIVDIVNELKSFSVNVEVVDPHASSHDVQEEYGFSLADEITSGYDGIILAVAHDEYKNKPQSWFKSICNEHAFLLDLKGIYRDKINELEYWSL
ncbi:nucleotide sugar dehydrogenase [Bacteroidia bacterium]|nr:nucleotide sugar dehydrogenase [Bacteroidia bacterium]